MPVNLSWPDGGAWLLATTSAEVDWQPAAAALAAASTVRTAVLVFGAGPPPGEDLREELATWVQADLLSVDEAVALVRTLAATHGLVLVVGAPGLLVPLGREGWTPIQLAVAVGAPVVIVTGPGPDAVNHTTLALGAVAGHGLAAAVITLGELPDDLPVTPAGRIPGGAAETWLDPALHASTGRPKADAPPPPPLPPPATTSGKRVVLLLAGVFVTMSVVVCGLAFCAPAREVHTGMRVELTARAERAGVPAPSGPAFQLPPGESPLRNTPPVHIDPRRSAGEG